MNPLRFLNPFYTRKPERDLAVLVQRVTRVANLVEANVDTIGYPDAVFASTVRSNLLTISDAMATGRTQDAKVMVDAMVLVLSGKDAAWP